MATTYSLEAKLNGQTIRKRTTDLNGTITAISPEVLHTEVFFTVKNGKQKIERFLPLRQAKRVFKDSVAREVFINNLLLT